jgi:hypothetical protein
MSALEWYLLVLAVVMFLLKFVVGVILVHDGGERNQLFWLFCVFVLIDVPLVIAATQNVTVVRTEQR